jgi:hypothetical protein
MDGFHLDPVSTRRYIIIVYGTLIVYVLLDVKCFLYFHFFFCPRRYVRPLVKPPDVDARVTSFVVVVVIARALAPIALEETTRMIFEEKKKNVEFSARVRGFFSCSRVDKRESSA